MLQYLQSWFPGWGGWSGKPVEGLSAERQEQWMPEEILGEAGSFTLAWAAGQGGACFLTISLLLVKVRSVCKQTKRSRDL